MKFELRSEDFNCINCNRKYSSNFCPYCGQKTGVEKITMNSIFSNAFSAITNMDRGFLYILKMMTINPKKLIHDFLLGKRKGILNPLSFLIISISLLLITESIFDLPQQKQNISPEKINSIGYSGGKFIRTYFKYFWICSIFPLALITKMIFKKFNYAEHLAINSFTVGYTTLISVISFIIFRKPAIIFDPITYIVLSILIFTTFKIPGKNLKNLMMTLVAIILFVLTLFLIIFVIGYLTNTIANMGYS